MPTVLANAVAAAETADADASRSMEPGPTMTSSPTKMVGKKPIAGRRAKDPNAAAAAAAKENAGPGGRARQPRPRKPTSTPAKKPRPRRRRRRTESGEAKAERRKLEKIDTVPAKRAEVAARFAWLSDAANLTDRAGRRRTDPAHDPRTFALPANMKLSASQRQYWDLKSTHADVVLFFKVGKFYELYEDDAEIGCRVLDWKARSIHWSPYDRVGVVNADP